MALSLLTYSIKIPTTASTVVVRPVLPIRSSLPSLRLTFPHRTPTSFISCCSSVSEKAATSGIDLKPDVERWPKYIPNKLPDKNYVRVLDTTLRDGEQSPGGALTPAQKLEIARKLAKLRVDVMDVGFPASSEEELEAVKTIAKTVGNEVDEETRYVPVICVISRCKHKDIEAAWEALKYAKKPRIYIFICTSEIHMKYKLKKTKEEVIEMAKSSIRFAKKLGFTDIQFGCEDGGRSEKDFLCKIMGEAIKEGVKTVTLADTVGINIPQEFGEMVTYLKANTPGIDDVVVSLHCHNDLGLATANTIAGVRAGARQVEVTVNGIGERSGNASLEEIVMALKCRGAYVMDGVYTTIDTSHIMAASRMVQEYTGLHVQPHKPIVGNNCFLHESGIHQDGMLKYGSTYEIFSPEDIGVERSESSGIVLGKLSGRHAVKVRLRKLGYEITSDEKLRDIFSRFRELTKQKKRITDADLNALMVLYGDEISSKISEGTVLDEPISQISSVV
ncbi:methylthioalkylmalate synthase 1, chloroplastic [Brassica rapa]|uniref:methylthioalkylmalate synthase n=2 Tax=Brassica TaxID=3705 RepID=A0A816X1G2_BRANA|nr:methylthioalkylmalate synthase 1, chloroplastic [Brassica rapa]XP_048631293.1 methylthioalkylmalate synthase 1, chloroplastic-like [Brassica napus]CAF2141203.1 unnamed protein product [Brassica napus]